MNRYLVIGLAKTGTTVISKTVQNSASIKNYYLEPQNISDFERLAAGSDDAVVKIIFDHWSKRPRLLNGIIYNEVGTNFKSNIFITRDPRAEFVSRINYVAFPYFQAEKRSEQDEVDWINLFRRKENDQSFSLRDLVGAIADRFGVRFTDNAPEMTEKYARYIGLLPDSVKTLVRYEDFVGSNLLGHPLAHLFSGSRDVGNALQRTRRSGGTDDWKSFVNSDDLVWLNERLSFSLDALGYSREIEIGGRVSPENCSQYVAKLITETRRKWRYEE